MSAPSFCSAHPGHRLCTRWLHQATMTCAGAMMAPSPTGKPPLGEATCLAHGHTAVNAPSLPSPRPQVLRKETLSCVFVAFSVTRPPSCLSRGGGGHPALTPGPSRPPVVLWHFSAGGLSPDTSCLAPRGSPPTEAPLPVSFSTVRGSGGPTLPNSGRPVAPQTVASQPSSPGSPRGRP